MRLQKQIRNLCRRSASESSTGVSPLTRRPPQRRHGSMCAASVDVWQPSYLVSTNIRTCTADSPGMLQVTGARTSRPLASVAHNGLRALRGPCHRAQCSDPRGLSALSAGDLLFVRVTVCVLRRAASRRHSPAAHRWCQQCCVAGGGHLGSRRRHHPTTALYPIDRRRSMPCNAEHPNVSLARYLLVRACVWRATSCAVVFVRLRLTAQMGCLRHPSTPRGGFCRPERCLATSCRARWANRHPGRLYGPARGAASGVRNRGDWPRSRHGQVWRIAKTPKLPRARGRCCSVSPLPDRVCADCVRCFARACVRARCDVSMSNVAFRLRVAPCP